MMTADGSDTQAWVLTIASSIACVFGSLFICFDLVVRKLFPRCQDFDLEKDKRFLVGGLSLGSGVLLFTALNKILPEGMQYLKARNGNGKRVLHRPSHAAAVLMSSFVAGVILCIALNSLLHRFTPESVVHCGDESHAHDSGVQEGDEGVVTTEANTEERRQTGQERDVGVSEGSPLLRKDLKRSQSSVFGRKCRHTTASACAGYTDPCKHEEICCTHTRRGERTNSSGVEEDPATIRKLHRTHTEHHHHVTQERHDLMRVGIQTALAISLHKLPEGFITFMANHRDSSLGFSIFLALGIHNLVEGFTIAFPLYLAFRSRSKAILAAFVLGGLSQPIGAIMAYAVTRTKFGRAEESKEMDFAYGILFGATAGFMSVISVSSMLPQAIRNDARDGFLFTAFFFLGTAIIGFSDVLAK